MQKKEELVRKYREGKLTVKDMKVFNIALPGVLKRTRWHTAWSPRLGGRDPVVSFYFYDHAKDVRHEVPAPKLREFCTPKPARVISKAGGLFKVKIAGGGKDEVPVSSLLDESKISPNSNVFIHQRKIVSQPSTQVYKKAVKAYTRFLREQKS